MTMPTDEERREVASRLRDYERLRTMFTESNVCAFSDALGAGYLDWEQICARLADLIEPEPERTCRDEGTSAFRCGRCGAFALRDAITDLCGPIPIRYCPNCGAKVVDE